MTDDFESAVAAVPTLTKDPGPEVKLALYALYKQATVGDVSGKAPRLHRLGRPGQVRRMGRACRHVG